MPELGDVEGFRRVAGSVLGSIIEQVDVVDSGVIRNASASDFCAELRGRTVGAASRVGKWLILDVSESLVLFHFGMTGSLAREDPGGEPDPFDRVTIGTSRGELRFRDRRRLGGLYLADSLADVPAITGSLGPDALSVSVDELRARLQTRRSALKTTLMDQGRVAGIGNFLSDEICWRAELHPALRACDLDGPEWAVLHRSLRSVLHAVARAGHTPRGPRWLTGARWSDARRCPRCGAPLQDSRIAGRHATWCPRCQPLHGAGFGRARPG